MFEDILVVTDRDDLAEVDVRHRSARERRFLDRLWRIAIELLFPTGPTTFEPATTADDIEIQTENATRHAIDLAQRHGARLHVLVVVDAVRYDTSLDSATEPLVEEGEILVGELVDEAERAGLSATGVTEVGRPARVILDYAEANDIDLIVLNVRDTGGWRSRFRRGLVGTLASRGSVPVYAVPRAQSGHPD